MTAAHYQEGAFPPEERLDWRLLAPLIGQASTALARYDGTLATIPNPGILTVPLLMREAVLSSRIEGTQATLGEVLEYQAGQAPASAERQADIVEIINYREAIEAGEQMLGELPLCLRVVNEAHRILLSLCRSPVTHKSVCVSLFRINGTQIPLCVIRGQQNGLLAAVGRTSRRAEQAPRRAAPTRRAASRKGSAPIAAARTAGNGMRQSPRVCLDQVLEL